MGRSKKPKNVAEGNATPPPPKLTSSDSTTLVKNRKKPAVPPQLDISADRVKFTKQSILAPKLSGVGEEEGRNSHSSLSSLFVHLPVAEGREEQVQQELAQRAHRGRLAGLPPAVLALGQRAAAWGSAAAGQVADPLSRIVGDDDRAASTAAALAAVVTEAEIATLVEREYARVSDAAATGGIVSQPPRLDVIVDRVMADLIRTPVQFLVDCRPLCIAQSAVIRYTKRIISEQASVLSAADTDGAAYPLSASAVTAFKQAVTEQMELFVDERICAAGDAIAALGQGKIVDGDVVLTYGANELVERLLTSALSAGRKFRVVLLSNPSSSGACIALLRRLVRAGARCDFAPLTSVSHVIRRVSKCFLGMDAMFNNGTGLGAAGTALVASVANDARVPVLALCQSYKYSERVQTDAITQNEMRDAAHVLAAKPSDQSGVSAKDLTDTSVAAIGLVYDVTPARFIDVVVSEVGLVPPTSVPAVIREVVQPSQGPTR